MDEFRKEVVETDKNVAQKAYDRGPKGSTGYGGKFGVQQDRVDKVGALDIALDTVEFQENDTVDKNSTQSSTSHL